MGGGLSEDCQEYMSGGPRSGRGHRIQGGSGSALQGSRAPFVVSGRGGTAAVPDSHPIRVIGEALGLRLVLYYPL